MRNVETFPFVEELKVSEAQKNTLNDWMTQEVEDARGSRRSQENLWRDLLRMYEGVPKNPAKYNSIVENAPIIEVTLGAIATDSIYAQAIDLLYTPSPLLTCRATSARWTDHAKATQRFTNHIAANECKLRKASEHSLFDNCQLGTGIYYIPFHERVRKTYSTKVVTRGPQIISVPPEDFLTPGGIYDDIQLSKWVAIRLWPTKSDLELRKKYRGWDIDHATPYGGTDWVRSRREALARSIESIERRSPIYETYDFYCYYDIDDDGIDEDLLVSWDYTSRSIMKIRYCPYDLRPFEVMRYQLRAHLFAGIGVMEMTRPYQEEMTELHNHQLINVMLANTRMWAVRTGTLDEGAIAVHPNKILEFTDPQADIKELKCSDIYNSLPMTQGQVASLAERRVGLNNLNAPNQSAVMGNRTPGITTLSLLQQVNRRFTPAFDDMRNATSAAVRQCVQRYAELVQDGDPQVLTHLQKILGEKDAALVQEVLSQPDFSEAVAVELTASSASTNRDADRQNAIMLVNLLGQYYQRTLELVAIASNPQTPPPVVEVAKKIATSAGEIIDRTIRTFDQIRDPQTFIIEIQDELDQGVGAVDQQGLQMLSALLTNPQGAEPPAAGVPVGTA